MVYPRNARSLAAWIPVASGDLVGMVGEHPPLQQSLERVGAKVVDLPPGRGPGPDTPPLAHLVVLPTTADEPWLASATLPDTVAPGGTVLVAVRHRSHRLRRGGWTAAGLARELAAAGVGGGHVFGVSHGLYNLRALVPLDAALMRWYADHAFLPRSYRGAVGVRVLCRLGAAAPLRAMFPVLVGVGTVGADA